MAKEAERRWQSLDFYGALGLAPGASKAEVRQAFRRAALACHPDKVPESDRESATLRFQLIAEAYEVLSRDDLRSKYDAVRPKKGRAAAARPQARAAAGRPQQPKQLDCDGCGRCTPSKDLRKCPKFCTNVICPRCELCLACKPVEKPPEKPCASCGSTGPAWELHRCLRCPSELCRRCSLCSSCSQVARARDNQRQPSNRDDDEATYTMREILLEMRFDEASVDEAVRRCSTVEEAIELIMARPRGPAGLGEQLNDMVGQLQSWIPFGRDLFGLEGPPAEKAARLVEGLTNLGYAEDQARAAARRCSSLEAAVEWLAQNPAVTT